MMTESVVRLPLVGGVVEACSIVVLGFGYMLVVWSVVAGPSWAARLCASPPLRWIGRISYAVYLWHWSLGLALIHLLAARFGAGPATPILYTVVALGVLLPLSELSYRLLEAPYFKKRTPPPVPAG